MTQPLLEVKDLDAWYGEAQALHGISLSIERGECVALLGRNGAGKTTTLRSIMGVLRKKRGGIRFEGQDIARLSSNLQQHGFNIKRYPAQIGMQWATESVVLLREKNRIDADDVWALLPKIARRPELVSAFAREQLAEGARTSEKSYGDALRERDRLIASFTDWAAPYDAILTPPATGEAPAPDTTGDARFCSRWSLLGAPAITIPTGLGPDRLPLGLQLVASPLDDARLLAAAAWAESVLPSLGAPPL